MTNEQLTANIVVLTTAISSLLASHGKQEQAVFKKAFEARIAALETHSQSKSVSVELIAAIRSESTDFLSSVF